jgi:hypothetical protein
MCTKGPHDRGDPTYFLERNPLWPKYLSDCEVKDRPHDFTKSFRIRALPRVLAKGPLKAYRGTIHKTKVPPTAL